MLSQKHLFSLTFSSFRRQGSFSLLLASQNSLWWPSVQTKPRSFAGPSSAVRVYLFHLHSVSSVPCYGNPKLIHDKGACRLIKSILGRFPWWLRGKESTHQCGKHSWSRMIPHVQRSEARVLQWLNLCSRAQELQLLKSACPRACAPQQEEPQQWEALQLDGSLHSLRREKTRPAKNK